MFFLPQACQVMSEHLRVHQLILPLVVQQTPPVAVILVQGLHHQHLYSVRLHSHLDPLALLLLVGAVFHNEFHLCILLEVVFHSGFHLWCLINTCSLDRHTLDDHAHCVGMVVFELHIIVNSARSI